MAIIFFNKKNMKNAIFEYLVSLTYNSFNKNAWEKLFENGVYKYYESLKKKFHWNLRPIIDDMRIRLQKNIIMNDTLSNFVDIFRNIKSTQNINYFDDIIQYFTINEISSFMKNTSLQQSIIQYLADLIKTTDELFELLLDTHYRIELFRTFSSKIKKNIGGTDGLRVLFISDSNKETLKQLLDLLLKFRQHFTNEQANTELEEMIVRATSLIKTCMYFLI